MSEWVRPNKIYFITVPDRSKIKIGAATDPVARLGSLQSGSHVLLEILAVVPGGYAEEKALHFAFWPHHSHCEWFNAHADIWAAIKSIQDAGVIPAHLQPQPGMKIPRFKWGPGSRKRRQEAYELIFGHA